VSEVRVSPDLSIAHIYVSIFPQDRVKETMALIEENTHKRSEVQLQIEDIRPSEE
jgi:ribosome-binding factor A